MALYKVDSDTADLTKVAGGTLYADLPIGSWIKNDMATIPSGFLKVGDTISQSECPELYAKYGSTVPYRADKSELDSYSTSVSYSMLTSSSGYTMLYDGFIEIRMQGSSGQASPVSTLTVNNSTIMQCGNYNDGARKTQSFFFRKGDVLKVANANSSSFECKIAYYKKSLIVKAKQTPVPVDLTDAVNESIIEELHYNNRVNTNVRAFITSSQAHTFTATKTGLLKAYMHKSGSGYTARLFVNGVSVDQLSCFGEDSRGTVLPWIADGGIDATLSSFVKAGDVIKIDSDESGSASTNSWYLYATVLQYKS